MYLFPFTDSGTSSQSCYGSQAVSGRTKYPVWFGLLCWLVHHC